MIIFKNWFKLPKTSSENSNKKGSSSNKNYLMYIAQKDNSLDPEKKFNELSREDCFTEEELKEILEYDEEEDRYLNYMDSRKNSHGLFSDKGTNVDLNEVSKEVKDFKGVTYRPIISLKEENAIEIGMGDVKTWQKKIQNIMEKAPETLGFNKDDFKWFGAIHMQKNHPHCHLYFYDENTKNPSRRNPVFSQKEIKNFKREISKEFYKERNLVNTIEKGKARDRLTDSLKKEFSYIKTSKKYNKMVSNKLEDISKELPKKGRIQSKFMPSNVKNQVKSLRETILNHHEIKKHYEDYKKSSYEIAKNYSKDPKVLNRAISKSMVDVNKRIDNLILKQAKELTKEKKIEMKKGRELEKKTNKVSGMISSVVAVSIAKDKAKIKHDIERIVEKAQEEILEEMKELELEQSQELTLERDIWSERKKNRGV